MARSSCTARSCKYYPQNPIALNDLGLCFARKGDTAQAVDALSRAVQQRPDSQRYRNNLAVVLVGAGQHAEAFEVLAAGGGPAAANYNLAWMLSRQGKGQEAIPYLHAALLSDPCVPARHYTAHGPGGVHSVHRRAARGAR